MLRLAERAARFVVVEAVSEPKPLIEIGLRLQIVGGDLVGQRPEPIPQRRKRVGEIRCRHRGLQFGWRDFGLRGSKTEQHAVRGEPALAGRLAEDEVRV